MYEKIATAIEKHTQKHRLVFWYDPDAAHRTVLDQLSLDATVLEIANDELAIKHRVVLEEPQQHFLVYAPYARPADEHNWLLDLLFAGFTFSTDLAETHREELGLGTQLRSFVADHAAYFENRRERVEPLAELVEPETETEASLAAKMISVLVGLDAETRRSPDRVQWSLFALIEEAVAGSRETWDAVCRYSLDQWWRESLTRYLPDPAPDIEPGGVAIEIVRGAWSSEFETTPTRAQLACWHLWSSWRTRYTTDGRFARVIEWTEAALGVRAQLETMSLDTLRQGTVFPSVDQEIAARLIAAAESSTPDWSQIINVARERVQSYWVRDHLTSLQALFTLLIRIVEFEQTVSRVSCAAGTVSDLVNRYTSSLYRVDQLYRTVHQAYIEAERPGRLSDIIARIDGRYVHQFLQPLAESWDQTKITDTDEMRLQRSFFDRVVAPYLHNGDKVVVIVSDALRYEAGEELCRRLHALNRTQAQIEPMVATAPTVTRVGMNALLPHQTLQLTADGSCLVDGKNIQGIDGRSAFLADAVAQRMPGKTAVAYKVTDILGLSSAVAREQFAGRDLVFLYSDRIDATADNAKTEHLLPIATEDEITNLVAMVRKLGSQLNRTHVVITADHGFLYQREALVAAHKMAAEKPQDGVRERRFMVGHDPDASDGTDSDKYRRITEDPGLVVSESPIVFAAGLFRIRKQGGGSRYVHGGLSMQERLIPVIRVRITRSDDVKEVSVALMKPPHAVITTPTYTVRFYQEQPVTEKCPPVTLVGFFRGADGAVISDTVEITFDSTDPADQNRGRSVEFRFGPAAVASNGKDVTLVLQRNVGGALVAYTEETYRYQTIGERDF